MSAFERDLAKAVQKASRTVPKADLQDIRSPAGSTPTSLLVEFVAELDRANAKFPDARRLPDGTGGGARKTWETLARNSCERAHREGRLTHTDVYDEETSEVMAAETVEALRKELIQVGAITIKWLLDIDSR